MKTIIAAVALFASATLHAQSDKFTTSMQANIAKLDSAKTADDFQSIAGTFTRIGDAEKTQWLPYYYAGFALARLGWMYFPTEKGAAAVKVSDLSGTLDPLAARINSLADKAEALATSGTDKADISTVRNMAATQEMMVNPQERWQTYGQQAAAALQKGMQADPNNPRLYYLQGMSVFNTPEQFGGGKAKAKPIFEKAVALYKAEQAKPLHPNWGKDRAEAMLALCQ